MSSLNNARVRELRRKFVLVGKRIFEEKLTSGSGGQISAKIPGTELIMIKPSGFSLGSLKPSDMVIIDRSGKKIQGRYNPSSETPFHTALYEARSDVGAVVHTHSPYATAFGIAGKELRPIWGEVFTIIRGVSISPYARPGSEDLAKTIVSAIKDNYALILRNHGVVSVGINIEDAYQTARDVEWLAQIQFIATLVGEPKQLEPSEIDWYVRTLTRPAGELARTYGNPEPVDK